MKPVVKFFAGRHSEALAKKIAKSFGIELSQSSVVSFSDGEFEPSYEETIRGAYVFLIQSTPPPSDNLMDESISLLFQVLMEVILNFLYWTGCQLQY